MSAENYDSYEELRGALEEERKNHVGQAFELFASSKLLNEKLDNLYQIAIHKLLSGKNEDWVKDAVVGHLTILNPPGERNIDGRLTLGQIPDASSTEIKDLISVFVEKYK